MDEPAGVAPRNRADVIVIVGYLLWVLIAMAACAGIVYLDVGQNLLGPNADLPTVTPSPYVSATQITNTNRIFNEPFSDSHNPWAAYPDTSSYAVRDGRLTLYTTASGTFAGVNCMHCASLDQPYYLQAELATDRRTDTSYGIIFGSGPYYAIQHFYLYQIDAQNSVYFLYWFSKNNWSLRTSGQSDLIKPYPSSNTLGIYVHNDRLEFYINGSRVDTYQESRTSFQGGGLGFYLDGSGPQLIVQNTAVYAIR